MDTPIVSVSTEERKQQRRAYIKHWREQNPEKHHKHRQTEQAKRQEKRRQARSLVLPKPCKKKRRRDAHRKWADKNREKRREYMRQWAQAHKDARKAYMQQWEAAHYASDPTFQLRRQNIWGKRRAQKLSTSAEHTLTPAQWQEIKQVYRNCCVYCGKKQARLTQDHITPLSKGGSHSVSNVVPACRSCNSKKNNGDVLCPIQPLLLTQN